MPWGRIDDTWYDHPKLEELGEDRLAGAGLATLAWSWCNRFLTDGRVPRATVTKLGGTLELADHLVAVGLWEAAADGYAIHDFLHYNDSREQVLKRRADEAKRKAEWRARRAGETGPGGTDSGTTDAATHDVPPGHPPGHDSDTPKMSRRDSRARDVARDVARIPTRPDPSRPNESLERGSAGARPDVQALLDRGWPKVTRAQRKVLDEVLARHDVTGPAFAAAAIEACPPDADPLEAVMTADRLWQEAQRRQADVVERNGHDGEASKTEAASTLAWLGELVP